MKIIFSRTADGLRRALGEFKNTITIGTQYKEGIVSGSLLHIPYSGNSDTCVPCMYSNNSILNFHTVEAIGIASVDACVLGCWLAMRGVKPDAPDFWRLIEHITLYGEESISEAEVNEENILRYYAFDYWVQLEIATHPFIEGEIIDFTGTMVHAEEQLKKILAGDKESLEGGLRYMEELEHINRSTFVECDRDVVLRIGGGTDFTRMYNTPDGRIAKAAVSFDTILGEIFIRFRPGTVPPSQVEPIVETFTTIAAKSHETHVIREDEPIPVNVIKCRPTLEDICAVYNQIQDQVCPKTESQ